MDDLIIRLIEQGGYLGIFALMLLEPPMPSEVVMGVGGFAVARGTMSFLPLLLAGTTGSTLGNYAWFLVGDRLGYKRLEPFVSRWGRWLTLDWQHIEEAIAFFRRHGQWIVFAMRLSPFLRTIISLPAGLSHMKHWRFLLFTFAGAALWNAALIKGGQLLAGYAHLIVPIAVVIVAVVILAYIWRVATWKQRH